MSDSKEIGEIVEKEIRFAVVMYGGVSLAIYINGVAQELLKMVRATSDTCKNEEKKSAEKIYHNIACLLSDKKLLQEVAQLSDFEEIKNRLDNDLDTTHCSSTKFVVDIISGTSAGGINGVFLAKALARNQSIEELKKLWLNEGDIAKLINDKKSVRDINLSAPKTNKSLLNSRRMFLKLLDAVDGMEEKTERDSLVGEVDLFITVTDFQGVNVPLRLLDKVVYERRYRHVFHFQHKNERMDFAKVHNPMLAFAARCTSAFPFAFEPMRLSDAVKIIDEACPNADEKIQNLTADKSRFFTKVKDRSGKDVDWEDRDLVDGGYLDNKPFSYAIDALSQRRADFQVERKLIYVEPSPEKSESSDFNKTEPPDALQNAKAAISELPRYETIREDLQRVLERNRLIERINRMSNSAERDIFTFLTNEEVKKKQTGKLRQQQKAEGESYEKQNGEYWQDFGMEHLVRQKGSSVLPYYRLRISSLTDDIARLVTRKVGFETDSEYFRAIYSLVNAWRDKKYVFYKEENAKVSDEAGDQNGNKPEKKETILAFLRTYDLNYRLRRLRFVQRKANELFRFDEGFRKDFELRQKQLAEIRQRKAENTSPVAKKDLRSKEKAESAEQKLDLPEEVYVEETMKVTSTLLKDEITKSSVRSSATLTEELKPSEVIWKICGKTQDERDEIQINKLRKTVRYFQDELKDIFTQLQTEKEKLISRKSDSNGLSKAIQSVKLTSDDLNVLLKINDYKNDDGENKRQLDKFLEDNKERVYKPVTIAADELKILFDEIFAVSRNRITILFTELLENLPDTLKDDAVEVDLFNAVCLYLRHFYYSFDEYDQISFPAFYETEVGEAVTVDVLRISPVDAKFLIDEEAANESRRKLAGTSLYNFGAFIDRVWRKNDIMWGRLDGAERLITAVLPGKDYETLRRYFAEEMFRIILAEELMESDKEELRALMAHSFVNAGSGIEIKDVVGKIVGDVSDDAVKTRLSAVLRSCFKDNEIVGFVRGNYEVERRSEPKEILRVISRATQVTGNIFENIADKHGQSGNSMRWISRLGQVFWGLVEVAAPNTIWNKIFKQWLGLIYAFEVILLIAATVFGRSELQQFAIISLVLTLIIHLTVLTLNDFMKGGSLWILIRFITVGLFIVLCLTGALTIFGFFFQPELWKKIVDLQTDASQMNEWQKVFPLAALFTLFFVAFSWREAERPNIRFIGFVTLGFVLSTIAFTLVLRFITQDSSAILLLEFAKNTEDIKNIAGDLHDVVRIGLKDALYFDSFFFVPLYTGFLVFFSRLLKYRRNFWRFKDFGWYKNLKEFYENRRIEINERLEHLAVENKLTELGSFEKFKDWLVLKPLRTSLNFVADLTIIGFISKFTIAIILIAGFSDLVENYFTYDILQTSIAETKKLKIDLIRWSATLKFGLIALTTLIFSIIFWRGKKWKIFSAVLILISIIGFAGLFKHQFIQPFMLLQIVVLLVLSFIFMIAPSKFKRA